MYTKKVYVGAYVHCVNDPVKKEKIINCCPNKDCHLYEKAVRNCKFCSQCGSKIEEMIILVPGSKHNSFDVRELLDDRLYAPINDENKHVYLTNMIYNKCGLNIDHARYDIEINSELISKEILEFENKNEKDIEKLKEIYGSDKVTIKYGVLVWFS